MTIPPHMAAVQTHVTVLTAVPGLRQKLSSCFSPGTVPSIHEIMTTPARPTCEGWFGPKESREVCATVLCKPQGTMLINS